MNENLQKLVAEAVINNVTFSGNIGTMYTVQDLFHSVGLKSINEIWKRTKKELEDLETDSLFETKNSAKTKNLQFQADVLKEVFVYKQTLAKEQAEAEKRKSEAAAKLAVLQKLKTAKELEALEKMSMEEIEKEIEKYS